MIWFILIICLVAGLMLAVAIGMRSTWIPTMSAITHIEIFIGDDKLGYYVAMYDNGEPGARSEGYGSTKNKPASNLRSARKAAERDFPGIPITKR